MILQQRSQFVRAITFEFNLGKQHTDRDQGGGEKIDNQRETQKEKFLINKHSKQCRYHGDLYTHPIVILIKARYTIL